MKPTRTWILIADGGRARVLENLGPGKGIAEVAGMAMATVLPAAHDLSSDRPGRTFESGYSGHHALEPKSDPHERLKHDFLTNVAGRIDGHFSQGAFDKLIIVAPPHALGELRGLFSDRVRAVTTGEVAKDLTKTPDHEIASHLQDVISL